MDFGYWALDRFPLRTYIEQIGFPLRIFESKWTFSINELGVREIPSSDFIGLISIIELADGQVFPSDFIRSGFLWTFIRLSEDDG
ncbi:unnamed protein product [Rhizophagus irregularis]|nr:unnamed protein product [Rhizophagus irregularis]